jgi:putative transposase
MAVCFKGVHCPPESLLWGVRWYVAYPLRPRHVEALMQDRGVHIDHSTDFPLTEYRDKQVA